MLAHINFAIIMENTCVSVVSGASPHTAIITKARLLAAAAAVTATGLEVIHYGTIKFMRPNIHALAKYVCLTGKAR
jgi:hypothetical protein